MHILGQCVALAWVAFVCFLMFKAVRTGTIECVSMFDLSGD